MASPLPASGQLAPCTAPRLRHLAWLPLFRSDLLLILSSQSHMFQALHSAVVWVVAESLKNICQQHIPKIVCCSEVGAINPSPCDVINTKKPPQVCNISWAQHGAAAASRACSQIHQEPCLLQGVFTSLNGGVGGGLGGLLGGFVYSTYGAAAVFQVGLIVISVGWILCTICQAIASCMCRTRMPTADCQDSDA